MADNFLTAFPDAFLQHTKLTHMYVHNNFHERIKCSLTSLLLISPSLSLSYMSENSVTAIEASQFMSLLTYL